MSWNKERIYYDFVLMPSRHSHKDTDNLPSVFKQSNEIFDLELSEEFVEFKNNVAKSYNNDKTLDVIGINLIITGLTPALDSFLQEIMTMERFYNEIVWLSNEKSNISVRLFHYDKENDNYRMVWNGIWIVVYSRNGGDKTWMKLICQ